MAGGYTRNRQGGSSHTVASPKDILRQSRRKRLNKARQNRQAPMKPPAPKNPGTKNPASIKNSHASSKTVSRTHSAKNTTSNTSSKTPKRPQNSSTSTKNSSPHKSDKDSKSQSYVSFTDRFSVGKKDHENKKKAGEKLADLVRVKGPEPYKKPEHPPTPSSNDTTRFPAVTGFSTSGITEGSYHKTRPDDTENKEAQDTDIKSKETTQDSSKEPSTTPQASSRTANQVVTEKPKKQENTNHDVRPMFSIATGMWAIILAVAASGVFAYGYTVWKDNEVGKLENEAYIAGSEAATGSKTTSDVVRLSDQEITELLTSSPVSHFPPNPTVEDYKVTGWQTPGGELSQGAVKLSFCYRGDGVEENKQGQALLNSQNAQSPKPEWKVENLSLTGEKCAGKN